MSKTEIHNTHPLRSLFERMENYERSIDLDQFDNEYANAWPLIKFSIYHSYTLRYLNKNSLFHRIKKRLSKNKKKADQLSQIFRDESLGKEINKENIKEIWISYASNRNMFSDSYNKFLDPYFHYLSEDKALMCEIGSTNQSAFYSHPIFENVEILNLEKEISEINKRLQRTSPQKAAILSLYSTKSKFKLAKLKKVFPEINIYSVVYEYEIFKYNFHLYSEFFKSFKKLERVYLSSYYFADRLGIIAAAKQFGIRCIDIQHGVQSSAHYAYAGWNDLLIDSFRSMPDGFLVYTQKEEQRLLLELAMHDELKVSGNLSFKYWNEFRKTGIKPFAEKKYLLYSLQNQIPDKTHFIWKALLELEKEDIAILFRLHPGYLELELELKDMLALKGITNYKIDGGEDIYDSMNDCLAHVTQFSSSTLDALLLGKTTILIDPRGKEFFAELINTEEKIIYCEKESEFHICIQDIIGE